MLLRPHPEACALGDRAQSECVEQARSKPAGIMGKTRGHGSRPKGRGAGRGRPRGPPGEEGSSSEEEEVVAQSRGLGERRVSRVSARACRRCAS